jgi:ribosomal protein L12E/L44/L45/RPP1/RPP2
MENNQIGTIDNPIILSDDEMEFEDAGPCGRFDVSWSQIDWDRIDAEIMAASFDEIDSSEMDEILRWCDEVEAVEQQRVAKEYTDSVEGIDMDEFFHDQEEEHRLQTYANELKGINIEEIFSRW